MGVDPWDARLMGRQLNLTVPMHEVAANQPSQESQDPTNDMLGLRSPELSTRVTDAPLARKQQRRAVYSRGFKDRFAGVNSGDHTTIVLRKLPLEYNRQKVVEMFEVAGFAGRFDFVYVPVDFHRWAHNGYAFVNMITHQDAERAMLYFDGFRNWTVKSVRVCSVSWGGLMQGQLAHIERYRNSPVMHKDVPDGYKPAIFADGQRVEFPPPTKEVQAPRLKIHKSGAAAGTQRGARH